MSFKDKSRELFGIANSGFFFSRWDEIEGFLLNKAFADNVGRLQDLKVLFSIHSDNYSSLWLPFKYRLCDIQELNLPGFLCGGRAVFGDSAVLRDEMIYHKQNDRGYLLVKQTVDSYWCLTSNAQYVKWI